jgi:hypothetical protein
MIIPGHKKKQILSLALMVEMANSQVENIAYSLALGSANGRKLHINTNSCSFVPTSKMLKDIFQKETQLEI